MNRPALLASVVLPLVVLAGCTGASTTQPGPSASPQQASAPAMTEPPPTTAGTPRETGTPNPLPSIPPKLPNEIVRSTFAPEGVVSEAARHRFVGQVVTLHVLCSDHAGEVEVRVLVDDLQRLAYTVGCVTPQSAMEDDSFESGTHRVTIDVRSTDGARGVAYLTEGDI